jgi:hypothetical protein
MVVKAQKPVAPLLRRARQGGRHLLHSKPSLLPTTALLVAVAAEVAEEPAELTARAEAVPLAVAAEVADEVVALAVLLALVVQLLPDSPALPEPMQQQEVAALLAGLAHPPQVAVAVEQEARGLRLKNLAVVPGLA